MNVEEAGNASAIRPNIFQRVLAVAACKAVRKFLRLRGSGGTALPGKAAMLFCRNILEVTSSGMEIVVVTGTNGKTTTSRMLEHAIAEEGTCLANRSGANLLSGITAEFTCSADWLGKPRKQYAVVECDEAALKQVVPLLHPKVIVVTNLFRDQLDRYGEVMHTLEEIRRGIEKAPESILCLNADCSLTASLADSREIPGTDCADCGRGSTVFHAGPASASRTSSPTIHPVSSPAVPPASCRTDPAQKRIFWFGLNTPLGEQKDVPLSDAKYCIRCGTAYQYRYHTYAHLGSFYCPACGYQRPEPDTAVLEILEMTASDSRVRIMAGGREFETAVSLPAVYNLYNAMAAVCAGLAFGLDAERMCSSLADVHSGFGRMETFRLGETQGQMILVKNPAGCDQALSFITNLPEERDLYFGLNDRTADGHDISWIWDVDFEKTIHRPCIRNIYVFGDRAEDLRLRLKYADVPAEKITYLPDSPALLKKLHESRRPVWILPNYTAMLSLREELGKEEGMKAFWE